MQEDLIELEAQEIPVYLFTGFLESGKTKFIQETLEDKRFNTGERTLLLICEEGEEEFEPDSFASPNVFTKLVEDESELCAENLRRWLLEYNAERVLIEYNGMWLLDDLYMALPENWAVYQEFMFADARSFISYNTNMRQLVFDKLKSCELIVFNRFDPRADITPFHKIVRAVNRGCDIAYEDAAGNVKYDDIVDPLPFDKKSSVIIINDDDYALWYRDLNEDMEAYEDKDVLFKAQVALSDELEEGAIIVGRKLMSCCADDISFAGLIATGCMRTDLENGCWIMLKAHVHISEHPGYDRPGPVLSITELSDAAAPENDVVSF